FTAGLEDGFDEARMWGEQLMTQQVVKLWIGEWNFSTQKQFPFESFRKFPLFLFREAMKIRRRRRKKIPPSCSFRWLRFEPCRTMKPFFYSLYHENPNAPSPKCVPITGPKWLMIV